jgi:hypothetical protein
MPAISLPKPAAFELFHPTTSHVSEFPGKTSHVGYQPPKNSPHRRLQNQAGAWASPTNDPTLPCQPLCGKILLGVPAARGSTNPMPGTPLRMTPLLSRWFSPYPSIFPTKPSISCRFTPRALPAPPPRLPDPYPPPLTLHATTPGHNHATKEGRGGDEEAARGGAEGEAGEHV